MKRLPTQERLNELLDYDPKTGIFIWKPRKEPWWWNGRFAGKQAGCIDTGYVCIRVDGERYLAHRIAWKITHNTEPDEIDHMYGETGDNRITRLRDAGSKNNARNRRKIAGKSLPKGVTKHKGAYRAMIKFDGKQRYLGRYKTAEQANAAYLTACKDVFGEFANPG